MAQITLDKLSLNHTGRISAVNDIELQERLMSMGCIPGEQVKVERFAPLGDPMAIIVGDTQLSIRFTDASKVVIDEDA